MGVGVGFLNLNCQACHDMDFDKYNCRERSRLCSFSLCKLYSECKIISYFKMMQLSGAAPRMCNYNKSVSELAENPGFFIGFRPMRTGGQAEFIDEILLVISC